MDQPIWRPSSQRIAASNMQRFLRRQGLDADSYPRLYEWSVRKPDEFWGAFSEFSGIRFEKNYETIVTDIEGMPGARWFEGATLNYAANLLKPEHSGRAIVFYGERGDRVELSWKELRAHVASVSQALRALGVEPGDRVAGYLPNRPETVVAMLATASIGGVWSSCSPDFGIRGVLDRFGQIAPKVLFATDGYFYNGKTIHSLPSVAVIAQGLQELEAVIVVPYCSDSPDLGALPGATLFGDLLEDEAELQFEALPFDHPLCILYSSGTTGAPKCIIHGAGGTLIQHQKEHMLHTDVKAGDTVFYFTTCGWMMWNWLVSALASGAGLLLFDGSPFHPDPGVLWRIAEREEMTVFGTSAKYLSALEKAGYRPRGQVNLSALDSVLSTGSPLAPASYDFIYRDVKDDVQLSSIAGGTDIISCFAVGNPILPVYRGELQCLGLGMKMEIFDEHGRAVREEKGELVCTLPFPSMPIGFWNDPDGRRYHAAYFERFPDVWCHGDYAELTARDGVIIYGRSDTALNPGGVRIGTAEIYRVVEQFDEVAESIAVGQEWRGDARIVLFLRLQPSFALDDELIERLRRAIRQQASPRHVPAKVLAVTDIPRTISGKIVELAVRDTIHGRTVSNTDVLANPEALEYFKNRTELS